MQNLHQRKRVSPYRDWEENAVYRVQIEAAAQAAVDWNMQCGIDWRSGAWDIPHITPAERDELTALCQQLRAVAGPIGPLHAWWDVIFDMEALLAGQETLLPLTPAEHIAKAHGLLQEEKG